MKKFIITLLLVLMFPIFVFSDELTVAAAANLQFTVEELKAKFEETTGIKVKLIISSSGKLTTQIENGAPFDIFLSADMDYPEILFKEGLTATPPKTYGYGVLVLWTLSKDINISKGIEVIKNNNVRKIAIANPKLAPYGREAVNAIKYYRMYKDVCSKLVYGENISQVNQFIVSKAADIGFTAKSIVLSSEMKNKGQWIELDPKSYNALAQGVVILKYGEKHHLEEAKKFYDFLFSIPAKEIFKKYGYILP